MLIAALAIAIALIAALMAYMMTQATLVRVSYSVVKNELRSIKGLTKQLCSLSWAALKYATNVSNPNAASIITGNFAKVVSEYSLTGLYISINTSCTLNWSGTNAYSNISLVTNVSSQGISIRNMNIKSGLYVNSSSNPSGTVINLTVMVCKCGVCFYTPITIYNTNLTGYVISYTYLGNGVTEFKITKGGKDKSIRAVEVTYDGVRVVVSIK